MSTDEATETPPEQLRTSPLHERHVAAGARFAAFGGWSMPVEYAGGGVLAEHGINVEGQVLATRGALGYVMTDVGPVPDGELGGLPAGGVRAGQVGGGVVLLQRAQPQQPGQAERLHRAPPRAEAIWCSRAHDSSAPATCDTGWRRKSSTAFRSSRMSTSPTYFCRFSRNGLSMR